MTPVGLESSLRCVFSCHDDTGFGQAYNDVEDAKGGQKKEEPHRGEHAKHPIPRVVLFRLPAAQPQEEN